MIRVEDVHKKYGDFTALHGVSFDVPKGTVMGLLGPNGAGKSTMMKIISCFMPATSGKVTVAGFDVFEEPMEVKKRVGYLPETPPLYMEMRVGEYLEYVALLKQIPKDQIPTRMDYVVEHCGLKEGMRKVIGTLSKGYRQRVGIAQALVHDPEVVILDEPTVGLDPVQIIEIRNLIKGLAQNHTVILSTHILPEVVMTCQKVVLINKGRMLADQSVDQFSGRAGGSLEQAYLKIITGEAHEERSV